MPELQRALATLAFTAKTSCSPYKELFEEGQWQELMDIFHRDLYKLHGLPAEALLTAHLQVGGWNKGKDPVIGGREGGLSI